MTTLLLAVVPAVIAAFLLRSLVRIRVSRLQASNHRGRPLPVVLGLAITTAAIGAALGILLAVALAGHWGPEAGEVAWVSLAVVAVCTAGFVDDLRGRGPRGLRGHLAALATGGSSSGILKVVVICAAGLGVAAVTMGERPLWDIGLAGVLAAAAANVGNGLDVAPGRCIKFFAFPATAILLAGVRSPAWLLLLLVAGAAAGVARADLRERAMLGDAGSNVLGFVVGAALAPWLTTGGLVLAAAVAVGLNVLADTLTFSRAIKAIRPLRWFDRLGRMPWGPRISSN